MAHLIVFEGPDGVGKTTLSRELAQGHSVRVSFPGKGESKFGSLIYDIYHNPQAHGLTRSDLTPEIMQLLHCTSQVELTKSKVLPLLDAGYNVILDRFWWSTLVYGLELGIAESLIHAIVNVERQVWSVLPTVVFLVQRTQPVRLESFESLERWQRLMDRYVSLAYQESSRYAVTWLRNDGPLGETKQALFKYLDVFDITL